MPLPQPTCENPGDPCCHTFFAVADHIVTLLALGQAECRNQGGCGSGELFAYVSTGFDVDDPLCDTLIVWLVNIDPKFGPAGVARSPSQMRATYRIRLRDSGYPIAQDDGITIYAPDPMEIHQVSAFAYSHGEKLLRDLINASASGALVPAGCTNPNISNFRALDTSGGCVGWQVDVTLDVPWHLPVGGS